MIGDPAICGYGRESHIPPGPMDTRIDRCRGGRCLQLQLVSPQAADGDAGASARPESGAAAISITGVVKRFDEITAVNGLDLEVPTGVCFGLLGPNGAGKSTTVSQLGRRLID